MYRRIVCCMGVLIFILSVLAGCVSPAPNRDITVTTTDLETLKPVNIGSVDVYTVDFRIRNPTNLTFANVKVTITLIPVSAYCHTREATIEIPVLEPREKRTERVSVTEFGDLDCGYTYRYEVISDPGTAIPYFGESGPAATVSPEEKDSTD